MADIIFCKLKVSFVVIFVYLWSTAFSENFLCPSVCSCLGNMVDCSKRNLDSIPTDLPTWVKILDLSSNKISSVLPSTFQGLTNLDELNLSGNKVQELDSELFRHLPHLKTLKLTYNELDTLPSFPVNYSLTHLLLAHNKLRSLSRSLLSHTPLLRQLDLGFNKITQLSNASFPLLPNLHELYVNNNRVLRLERGALDGLPNLEVLKLGKNQIEALPAEVFRMLGQLKKLDLYRNKLRVIEGLTFSGLEKLSSLKLKRNNITQLSDGAFWGLSNINTLELDNNSLTQLKKAGLYGLESLKSMSLTHNQIAYIEPGCWEFCPHLTELQLSHNVLEHITTETFSKLKSLRSLWLNSNRVTYIAYKAFSDLYSLETLELNGNQISGTVEDMQGPFEGLVSLRRLSLEGNHIKSLGPHSFRGLEQLRQLELGGNAISSLQNNVFLQLKELQSLSLNTSALLCDCKLEWFAHWLNDTGFQGSVSVKCAYPQLLRGISLVEVSHFKCEDEDFLKPVILQGPRAQIALKGSNVSLECRAASSSESRMEIHWRKDNVQVNSAKINTTATLVDALVSMRSTLLITRAEFDHAGAYQCVASNDIGPSYSEQARISVQIFPVFTKTPKDVTKKSGLKIELECAATGEPAPEISWQKDGGDDFPAARERRMHVQPDQDVFFISSVKVEDMGVYSCTASNAAGTVVTNATVTVLEVPKFAEPMRDLSVETGETAVLECMAAGSPAPRLQWMKDDASLTATQRHFFTAEDQLLVIVEARPEDAGKYTCIMTNTLGSERGSLQLDVIRYGGGGSGAASFFSDNSTTTGIIIIAVVCCVVGTSLIWVVIIYQTRRKQEEYSSTPTEETNVPDSSAPYSEPDRSKLRTIYTSSGAKVYMNGGSTRLLSAVEHMNGGFHITSNPLDPSDASWEAGRGEYEQDHSREHLMSPGHYVTRAPGLPRQQSSGSVTTDSHASSSPGTQSTQSTIVLSTFHPHGQVERGGREGQGGDTSYNSFTFPRPQTPQNSRHKTVSCSQIHRPTEGQPVPEDEGLCCVGSSSGQLDTNHNSKGRPVGPTDCLPTDPHLEPHVVVHRAETDSHSHHTEAPDGSHTLKLSQPPSGPFSHVNTQHTAAPSGDQNRTATQLDTGALDGGSYRTATQPPIGAPNGDLHRTESHIHPPCDGELSVGDRVTTGDSIAGKRRHSSGSVSDSSSSGGEYSESHTRDSRQTACDTRHPSNNNGSEVSTSPPLPQSNNNNCRTQILSTPSLIPPSYHDNKVVSA